MRYAISQEIDVINSIILTAKHDSLLGICRLRVRDNCIQLEVYQNPMSVGSLPPDSAVTMRSQFQGVRLQKQKLIQRRVASLDRASTETELQEKALWHTDLILRC